MGVPIHHKRRRKERHTGRDRRRRSIHPPLALLPVIMTCRGRVFFQSQSQRKYTLEKLLPAALSLDFMGGNCDCIKAYVISKRDGKLYWLMVQQTHCQTEDEEEEALP